MNFDATSMIQKELDSGEKLLWAGMPKQGFVLRSSDIFMVPFSFLFGAFIVFWEFTALSIPAEKAGSIGFIFPMFGIPFVLIGLYMIFGRFIYDSMQRAKTFYGLTNTRVIIVSGIFNKNIKSLNLTVLPEISLSEKRNLYGTIFFGSENPLKTLYTGNGFPGAQAPTVPKFELIENSKEVYNKIRQQQLRNQSL